MKTKQFTRSGSLLTARYKHPAGLLPDGRVLIAGDSDDHDWQGKMSGAEVYDPDTQKFTAIAPMNDSRFKLPGEAVQVSSGQLLVAGSEGSGSLRFKKTGSFLLLRVG
jgi:hypothetical protein